MRDNGIDPHDVRDTFDAVFRHLDGGAFLTEKTMSQYRDLMALQHQVDRLQRVKQPPALRMVRIFDESRPEQPIGEYTLAYKIEPPLDWHKKDSSDEEASGCLMK